VFADDSGAAVIPAVEVEQVIEGARAVQREDAGFREQIARERLGAERRGPEER
jgi:regulator of RNase E activity RraA